MQKVFLTTLDSNVFCVFLDKSRFTVSLQGVICRFLFWCSQWPIFGHLCTFFLYIKTIKTTRVCILLYSAQRRCRMWALWALENGKRRLSLVYQQLFYFACMYVCCWYTTFLIFVCYCSIFTLKQIFGPRTAIPQPIWIQFCIHLLLYGTHFRADLDRDRPVGGSRPKRQNVCFFCNTCNAS